MFLCQILSQYHIKILSNPKINNIFYRNTFCKKIQKCKSITQSFNFISRSIFIKCINIFPPVIHALVATCNFSFLNINFTKTFIQIMWHFYALVIIGINVSNTSVKIIFTKLYYIFVHSFVNLWTTFIIITIYILIINDGIM